MSVELSYEEAVELLERAVNEKGEEYVYRAPLRGCVYFEGDGKPSCMVGHALAYKGATLDDLESIDSNSETNVGGLVRDGFLQVDSRTFDLLEVAQDAQDGGKTWGEAFRKAARREVGA